MNLKPYRQVLAVRGVRPLLLIGILARVPATATGMALTLFVSSAGQTWARAGLVVGAFTVGAAVGQPLTGRLVDRRGLRAAMVFTTFAQLVIWPVMPLLPYLGVVVAAAAVGALAPPVFPAVRLGLTALVPADDRRAAFALDSMIVELSYMVGPATAVVVATSVSPAAGLYALAAGMAVSGFLLCWLNPPTQPEGHEIPEVAPPRRTWFSPGLVALMVAGASATFVLSASELALVATLRETGQAQWTGLAIAVWCAYSLMGGLVFGSGRWRVSALGLIGALGLLTIPVGLAGGNVLLLLLFLLPSGVLCAPAMTAANDNLTRIVPPASLGEATGVLGSAFLVGIALGSPFGGTIIDSAGPGWAFAAAGAVSAVLVLAGVPFYRRQERLTAAAEARRHAEAGEVPAGAAADGAPQAGVAGGPAQPGVAEDGGPHVREPQPAAAQR